VNPFVGVPISDYVRDAVAIFCLFATLGMPWDLPDNDGADRWWVVLAVLVSVASLALPYVGKAQLVPGWTPALVRLLKLGANVPFLACVLASLINELVNISEPGAGGIGTGVAMGLAGVTLAVQPRQADEDPSHRDDRTWVTATNLVTALAAAAGVLAFVAHFLDDLVGDDGYLFNEVTGFFYVVVSVPVTFLLVVGWPALSSLTGSPAWRRVFAAVGTSVLVTALFALADDGGSVFSALSVEKWNSPVGGTVLLAVATALAVSRPVSRQGRALVEVVSGWIATASSALMVSAATLFAGAVTLVIGLLSDEEVTAAVVVVVVLLIASAGLAVTSASMLSDVRRTRSTVVALLGGQLLLSVITLAVIGAQDLYLGILVGQYYYAIGLQASGWAVAMWFALPALALYALLGPAEVRSALGPLMVERQPAAPNPGWPTQPPAPQQPPYGQQPPFGQQPPYVQQPPQG
jgi:hypothetical protein